MIAMLPGKVRWRSRVEDDDGAPLALLGASHEDDGSNPDVLRVSIMVDPDQRRRGVGSLGLSWVVDKAKEIDRERLSGHVFDTDPTGWAFAEAVGAEKKLDFHMNVLNLSDLDFEMLAEWADDGPRRAPGYSIEVIEDEWPEQYLDDFARLWYVLERDMPMPEGHQPREWTADLMRGIIKQAIEHNDSLTAVAFEDATQRAVGLSHLIRRHADPKTWVVTTTMVEPEHRGRAIGKWVKAEVNLAAHDRWPGAEWTETGNAFTNDAMLGINHAMGFRHEYTNTNVQVTVARAEAYLQKVR